MNAKDKIRKAREFYDGWVQSSTNPDSAWAYKDPIDAVQDLSNAVADFPALLAVVEAAVAWREADKRFGECPSCASTLGVLEAEALSEMVRAVDAFMAASDAATDEPRIGKTHTAEMLEHE